MRLADGSTKPLRVLFVCTENAGRSQIAEALLRQKGAGKFLVKSAGSRPAREINPLALAVLREQGIDWTGHRPKGFDSVLDEHWDMIITLCDKAREACPAFPGQPVYAHWGMPDPAAATGDDAKHRAFVAAAQYLRQRVDYMLLVPFEKLAQGAIEHRQSP